ncbi:hypothetical protein EV702DRAFT_1043949 [Suillus placidus]|uniref:Uncharacterized protein n=1 Tax=Suillus placidus TaxID=48579 RepID=A0A9P7D4N4_9AGAM|nr:hypothetical protein EV702DRAFT_1043949 [Suillus placidus]
MSIFAYQARLAARPAGGQKKKSRHHDSPSPKHMEEPISQTFHPPVLARAHAHQFIHSQGCDSSAEPPASNNNFVGQGAYRARIFERAQSSAKFSNIVRALWLCRCRPPMTRSWSSTHRHVNMVMYSYGLLDLMPPILSGFVFVMFGSPYVNEAGLLIRGAGHYCLPFESCAYYVDEASLLPNPRSWSSSVELFFSFHDPRLYFMLNDFTIQFLVASRGFATRLKRLKASRLGFGTNTALRPGFIPHISNVPLIVPMPFESERYLEELILARRLMFWYAGDIKKSLFPEDKDLL